MIVDALALAALMFAIYVCVDALVWTLTNDREEDDDGLH